MKIITSASVALDISQEKKDLRDAIRLKEKQLTDLYQRLENLKREISGFQETYDIKIRQLYARLDELNDKIFKYQNISEFMDDHFSFSEAEKVIEETVEDTRGHMENEYERTHQEVNPVDRKIWMSKPEREELKRLYRKLAHLFHPDLVQGNGELMTRINKAYSEGDLKTLQEIELNNCPEDNKSISLSGLKMQLTYLIGMVEDVKAEMRILRGSDVYRIRRRMLKSSGNQSDFLGSFAIKIKQEIERKEIQLADIMEKFG